MKHELGKNGKQFYLRKNNPELINLLISEYFNFPICKSSRIKCQYPLVIEFCSLPNSPYLSET